MKRLLRILIRAIAAPFFTMLIGILLVFWFIPLLIDWAFSEVKKRDPYEYKLVDFFHEMFADYKKFWKDFFK